MARFFLPINDPTWFDELKIISSYYESELENTIQSHIETVFPEYIAIPYKKDIYAPGVAQGRAPDLALIRKDYSDWWIVEVELEGHSIKHVKAQVECFLNGTYNSFEVAKYIKSKDNDNLLNFDNLQVMINNHQPKVMIIVDDHVADWKDELKKLDVKICVFQVFKSTVGHRAYRLNGQYPFIFSNESHCKFLKTPANLLEVLEPDWFVKGLERSYILPKNRSSFFSKEYWLRLVEFGENQNLNQIDYLKDREVEIDFEGKLSRWKVIENKNKILLKAIGVNILDVNGNYRLYANSNFKLFIKPN